MAGSEHDCQDATVELGVTQAAKRDLPRRDKLLFAGDLARSVAMSQVRTVRKGLSRMPPARLREPEDLR